MRRYLAKVFFLDERTPQTFESNCHPRIREGAMLTQILTNDCDVVYIATKIIEHIEVSKVS
jgi:hypothetical protein